jgi:hypothetical protein
MTSADDAWGQVLWPAVLRYAGADELSIVSNRDEWDIDPELHAWPYRDEDRLVDANGVEYRLGVTAGANAMGQATVEATGTKYSPAEFQQLVERHLKASGAPEGWLATYLADFQDGQRIRATMQYLLRNRETTERDGAEEEE